MRRRITLGLAATAMLVLAVVLAARLGGFGEPTPWAEPTAGSSRSGAPSHAGAPAGTSARATADRAAREEVRAATAGKAAPTSGALAVEVRFANGEGARGVTVHLEPVARAGEDEPALRRRTGDDGRVRFAALDAGRYEVRTDRKLGPRTEALVRAGAETTLVIELRDTMNLRGVVVDPDDVPVAGAAVELASWSRKAPETVALTDDAGRFEIRGVRVLCSVGAWAAGYAPSVLHLVQGQVGSERVLRLRLRPGGGSCSGRVLGAGGEPIAGARLQFGSERPEQLRVFELEDGTRGMTHCARVVDTGPDGRFVAVGLPAGTTPIAVRAPGFGAIELEREIPPAGRLELELRLDPAAYVAGVVRGPEGRPVAGATVATGRQKTLTHTVRTTDDGGRYRLPVPAGRVRVQAEKTGVGSATAELATVAGQETPWQPQLAAGVPLRGLVRAGTGEPLADVTVEADCRIDGELWFRRTRTGSAGRFEIVGCPEGRTLYVLARRSGYAPAEEREVVPGEELVLELRRERANAFVRGVVELPDGRAAAEARVIALPAGQSAAVSHEVSASTGAFEIGPLPAGSYALIARAPGCCAWKSAARELAAGEVWDAGRIALTRGGTVRVAVDAGASELSRRATFEVLSSDGTVRARLAPTAGQWTTKPLLPGEYTVAVSGREIAGARLPVAVTEGVETVARLRLQRGYAARFSFRGGAPGATLFAEVRRGQDAVWRRRVELDPDGAATATCWLADGTYELGLPGDAGQRSWRFSVTAAGEGGSVQIDLDGR